MENIFKNFRNHFFLYIIVLLVFVIGIFSYYRFMIKQDYSVGYEGVCDPATDGDKCFVGCDDDACTKQHYYTKMAKYAPDLKEECGEDITDCESADLCLPDDRNCSITYCNPEIEGDTCATEINTQDDNGDTEEESSQNNE